MRKIILFGAVILFALATLVGCTLSGLNVKVEKATTDEGAGAATLLSPTQ